MDAEGRANGNIQTMERAIMLATAWRTLCAGILSTFLLIEGAAAQESYPTRSILLTHGFAAGGNGDVISRVFADGLSTRLKQPVAVEPRPGAGGNTASARLLKSPPDGYTLVSLTGAHAVSAAIYKSLSFDPMNDFQMISTYGYFAFLIAVRSDSAIKSVADLIKVAKSSPGKLTYSSPGVGSTQHLAGELFASMAGVKMTHVPYRGGTGPIMDLIGGQIDVSFESMSVVEPQYTGGVVRVLGVTSSNRWPSMPEIEPVATTVPGYDVQSWMGLASPRGLPQPIVQRLYEAVRSVLADTGAVERLRKLGMNPGASTPKEMETMISSQIAKWKKVVADSKIPQR
ncbi:MAG: tripartite tricarboxylate transporter substrate binding protein [Alphaproteobacteria bacterium]|nr:tripartite tricarboxylate transporter substrate binding protein [Alphaproteobacteria bacterium]